MKAALAFIAIALGLSSAPAQAWGPEAHAMIAAMAEAHLTPRAATHVRELLAQDIDVDGKPAPHQHLDEIASWADAWRAVHPETLPWHFVDIPLDAKGYDKKRDCPRDEGTGENNCIVAKLPEFFHVLADTHAPADRRVETLKYVVHFVGDIAQPLHAESRTDSQGHSDHGGNAVRLAYNGQATSLHLLWDYIVVEKHYGWPVVQPPDYAFDLAAARSAAAIMDARISPAARAAWAERDPLHRIEVRTIAWANESHAIASMAYVRIPHSPAAESRYQARAWPVIERALQKASVRLAAVLNAAL